MTVPISDLSSFQSFQQNVKFSFLNHKNQNFFHEKPGHKIDIKSSSLELHLRWDRQKNKDTCKDKINRLFSVK